MTYPTRVGKRGPRVEDVRASVSLLDVLPPGTDVKRIGHDKYVTLCVFHGDDRPSLRLTLYRGAWRYHCFACGADGDVVDFVMKTRGVSFRDALAQLGEGRTFDLTIRRPTRKPGYVVACTFCPARRELDGGRIEAIVRAEQLGWHVSDGGNYDLCPACVEKRLADPWRGGQQASHRRVA